ncbi:MAG: flagellar hook-associated protein FlgK [Acidobacteria bacterium]|nr:flagellar hook-associated protein FlgK [Acidobacteriota bacterium]
MSGLFSILTMTSHALDAQRAGLSVTGNNIANLNTEGYSRRALLLAESLIGGVEVQGIRARRDLLLEARVRQEIPAEAREAALADSLSVVETALGRSGESIDGRLSAFFDGFSALASDPSSTVARDGVLQQGRLLARSFNDMAARLTSARRDADTQVRAGVNEVNALATRVARLNQAIGGAIGGDAEALRDEREVALQQLAELADVSVLHRDDGAVDVSIAGGRALVVGADTYPVEVTSTPPAGLASLSIGGADITTSIARGRLAGALDARDTRLPAYQARLDELAYGVAQSVNTVHQGGFDLNGNPGQAFFAPLAGVAGAAAALQLDAAIDADPTLVAASGTGAPGDNQTARALADLRDTRTMSGGTATFSESWGQLVYRVGSDTQTARAEQQSRHEVVAQVARLRDQVSGVSLDEESANMLKFQRAYEANARFFSTVNTVLDSLMSFVGAS